LDTLLTVVEEACLQPLLILYAATKERESQSAGSG
jgi:hypothetical protein